MRTTTFGAFVLDPKRRVLLAYGKPVKLQARAFDILAYLVTMRERPVTRDEILAFVWQGQVVAESNLTVQMSNLRRALADNGAADLIITIPNRSYRFIGEVVEQDVEGVQSQGTQARAGDRRMPDAAESTPDGIVPVPLPPATPPPHSRDTVPHRRPASPAHIRPLIEAVSARAMLAALGCAGLAGAFAWGFLASSGVPAARAMVAHVRVEVSPDEVYMKPGALHYIDYRFTLLDRVDLQLETEDWQFVLISGKPVGAGIVGGRIYNGSFPIRGGTTGVYHNNIYLIPAVAALARAAGSNVVQIRHVFHLRDPQGNELRLPAVLLIHLDPWAPPP